ncbi:hypothetical protein XENTR_v10024381 [Xenopus tropicalis]|nr:hypothetical protein XENTR_v10024381 [Xenopus tropicalis]
MCATTLLWVFPMAFMYLLHHSPGTSVLGTLLMSTQLMGTLGGNSAGDVTLSLPGSPALGVRRGIRTTRAPVICVCCSANLFMDRRAAYSTASQGKNRPPT